MDDGLDAPSNIDGDSGAEAGDDVEDGDWFCGAAVDVNERCGAAVETSDE